MLAHWELQTDYQHKINDHYEYLGKESWANDTLPVVMTLLSRFVLNYKDDF